MSGELDREAIDRLLSLGGVRFLRKMIEAFLTEATARVDAAQAGAGDGDLESVRQAMHSLKSTAANLGAQQLRLLATEMETAAEAGDAVEVTALTARLSPCFAAAKVALMAVHSSEKAE